MAEDTDYELRSLTSAISERIILARMLGMTHAGKRDVYGVLGYDDTISWRQYRDRYARGGIAGTVVDARPNAVWRGEGGVFEDEDPETETQFEAEWATLNTRFDVWPKCRQAHILASLGSFSGLMLGGLGDWDLELPHGRPGTLLYISPKSGGVVDPLLQQRGRSQDSGGAELTVASWEESAKSPRFGLPLTYYLKNTNVTNPDQGRPVHWSRIVHIPAFGFLDNGVYGPPALERVWNYLLNLDKVEGGGSEAFWLRANAGTHINVDKKMTLSADPKAAEKELQDLKDQADAYAHQLTRMMRTRGVDINQLGSDVADFKGPVDTLITLIAGTCRIPKRIFVGSERGELSSGQDADNWDDEVKDCRNGYAYPTILRPLVTRLIDYGYLTKPAQWKPLWPDIAELTAEEKIDTATKANALNANGQIVITSAEIRETYLDLDPLTEDELQVEQWRADLAGKMAKVNAAQGETVFTDEEIRELCYGWDPLTDAQRQEIADRKAASMPVPVGPDGNPVPPVAPAEERVLRALEQAIEDEDLEAIGRILGDVAGHEFHGNQWTSEGGGGKHDEEEMFLSSPKDAYDTIAIDEHATVVAADVRKVLEHAVDSQEGPVDLTKLTVEGTPIFAGGLNRARDTMPQIPKEHQERFLKGLADKNIGVKEENVSPSKLRPTQNEIDAGRVGEKLRDYDKGKKDLRPIMVSKDNYVLDGHHRWAVMATLDVENPSLRVKQPVIRIMQDHKKALSSMLKYTRANKIANRALEAIEERWDVSEDA